MYSALLILLILDCFALMVVILLQAGKGGGLAAGFGGAGTGIEMMGSRQTATFLHNATRWLGSAFMLICFFLSLLAVRATGPQSLIESETRSEQAAPSAGTPAAGTPSDLEGVLGGTPAGEQETPPATGESPAPQEPPAETPPRP